MVMEAYLWDSWFRENRVHRGKLYLYNKVKTSRPCWTAIVDETSRGDKRFSRAELQDPRDSSSISSRNLRCGPKTNPKLSSKRKSGCVSQLETLLCMCLGADLATLVARSSKNHETSLDKILICRSVLS